jgi:hypothetical protein
MISLGTWKWIGSGWRNAGDEWLAARSREAQSRSRSDARETMCIEQSRFYHDMMVATYGKGDLATRPNSIAGGAFDD